MFGLGPATRIYLAAGVTDMRKGFEGLYGMVCKCISRIGSLRVEQILMLAKLGIQEGNRRLARRPPIGESSNVIVPS